MSFFLKLAKGNKSLKKESKSGWELILIRGEKSSKEKEVCASITPASQASFKEGFI